MANIKEIKQSLGVVGKSVVGELTKRQGPLNERLEEGLDAGAMRVKQRLLKVTTRITGESALGEVLNPVVTGLVNDGIDLLVERARRGLVGKDKNTILDQVYATDGRQLNIDRTFAFLTH